LQAGGPIFSLIASRCRHAGVPVLVVTVAVIIA